MTDYDAVVVGAGIVGAAVAFHLAAPAGHRVLICEQARVPGRGATAKSGALIRQQHTTHCQVPLAVEGLKFFRDWSNRLGGDCGYRRTGFAMVVGEKFADHLKRNVAAVNEASGEARVLDPDELTHRHPGLAATPGSLVGYEADAGYIDPMLAASAFVAGARGRGATLAEGVRVTAVTTSGSRVTGVRTNLGDITARQVVVCGGAWSGGLTVPFDTAPVIEPRRIGVAQAAVGAAPGALPIGIDDLAGTYFRPGPDRSVYFGVALDPRVDPDTEPAPVTAEEARDAAGRLSGTVPALRTAALLGARVGFDAFPPDKQPLIGGFGPEGLYLCTGFSGGGVKTAPAVGALVARELRTGAPERLLAPFRPSRFADGQPIESDFPYDHS